MSKCVVTGWHVIVNIKGNVIPLGGTVQGSDDAGVLLSNASFIPPERFDPDGKVFNNKQTLFVPWTSIEYVTVCG